LFCEDKFKCEDPFWEDRISSSIKEIDDNIKRLMEVADPKTRKKLLEKGEKLKERNRKFGNAPPSTLLIVAKKPFTFKSSA
jgi:hypothetical protein